MAAKHSRQIYFEKTAFSGTVDHKAFVIRGVSVITGGVKARGHDLWVDDKCLEQILLCGKQKVQVPVKENHRSGVENIVGFLSDFRMDDGKVKADWQLLEAHPNSKRYLDMAEKMPSCIGLSAAFEPPDGPAAKSPDGTKCLARCQDLLSVDLVTTPAANPSGMFDAVDNGSEAIMPTPNPEQAEPTLADVLAALTATNQRLDQIDQRISDSADTEITLDDLRDLAENATDEELAEYGTNRETVQAQYAQALAESGASEGEETEGTVDANGAAAAQGSESAAVAVLAAKVDGLITELNGRAERSIELSQANAIKAEFSAIRDKVVLLSEANIQLSSENEALRYQIANPSAARRAVSFGVASDGKGGYATEFEAAFAPLVGQPNPGNAGKPYTKGEAIAFCARKHPELHRKYLSSLSQSVTHMAQD